MRSTKEDFEKMEDEVTSTNEDEDTTMNNNSDDESTTESGSNSNEKDEDNQSTSATEGMKNKIDISEFSEQTKNLIADLDQMNPVMEKSLKILEGMDMEKMQNMMEKFKSFQN